MAVGSRLNGTLTAFIERQKVFFVATADRDGRVNVSPKGASLLRVASPERVVWMNLSGSGNETAAHVRATGRMTLMFCAFEGPPMILRVYGLARVCHPRDGDWAELAAGFPQRHGNRQVFELSVDMVQTSCGTGVPLMDHAGERAEGDLIPFFEEMGAEGVAEYWRKKNATSIDGKPTGILADD